MEKPAFTAATRISLHPLTIRPEDGEFIVGRLDTGTFVSLPEIGVRALEVLRDGMSLQEAEARLTGDDGSTVDLEAFAAELLKLGYVAAIDGQPVPSPRPQRNDLPWLQAAHLRWVFSLPVAAVYVAILTCAAASVIPSPHLIPRPEDFFWSPTVSLVLVVNLAFGWLQAGLHEMAHLIAARAQGLPANIRPGTRLQYLVLQTDVSAAWTLPRARRYRIYLAGILWDLLLMSVLILIPAHASLPASLEALLAAWALLMFLGVIGEFSFYMRTDIYFVFLDLLHSRDLFHDARRLLFHTARRLGHATFPRRRPPTPDPLLGLTISERRKVAFYAGLLITGTVIAVGTYLLYGIPILLRLVVDAAARLGLGLEAPDLALALDGALTLLAVLGMEAAFLAVWVHGRRTTLASAARRIFRRSPIARSSLPRSDTPGAAPTP